MKSLWNYINSKLQIKSRDKKIKELEDWKKFAIKEIFEWHKIAEYLSNKMKVGDYMPVRCLEIIKELEKDLKEANADKKNYFVCAEGLAKKAAILIKKVVRLKRQLRKLKVENKALNKENDGLREQNIELLETLADYNKLKEENKRLRNKK